MCQHDKIENNRYQSLSMTSAGIFSHRDRLAARDSESGWLELHPQLMMYRQQYGLSIMQFLQLCGLPDDESFFIELASARGHECHPKNSPRSVGRRFIDNAKRVITTVVPIVAERGVEDCITDLRHDSPDEVSSLGISGMFYQDRNITVRCLDASRYDEIRALIERTFTSRALSEVSDVHLRVVQLLTSTV